jgi:hypothetical protein
MDRIIFGDNQFFGVNHASEAKAREQLIRFQDDRAIIKVLEHVYRTGIRTFMCTTHDRMAQICDHFRANAAAFPDFQFYPCMPYAHKYANAVTERGVLDALKSFLPEQGAMSALFLGATAVASKDAEVLGRLLIDAEMKMFAGLRTPVIFLQNVVTDLLLGLGVKDGFRIFSDYVRERYQAEPGFITMNLPRLLDTLESVGIVNPIVCANFNKAGFRMCGGVEAYERVVAERQVRLMAMSVFASGAISPRTALEYVCGQASVQSIVFGASTPHHIEQTKRMIDELWSPGGDRPSAALADQSAA